MFPRARQYGEIHLVLANQYGSVLFPVVDAWPLAARHLLI